MQNLVSTVRPIFFWVRDFEEGIKAMEVGEKVAKVFWEAQGCKKVHSAIAQMVGLKVWKDKVC